MNELMGAYIISLLIINYFIKKKKMDSGEDAGADCTKTPLLP